VSATTTQRWAIGDVQITKIIELEATVDLQLVLPDLASGTVERHAAWLRPHFIDDDGNGRLSVHGLVIDTGTRRILVDPCIGERRGIQAEPSDGFLDRLARAGYTVDDIDTVLCTHLHFDHTGWNTHQVDGQWVVTFPNARYLFGRAEWERWRDDDGTTDDADIAETVRPVVDAGAADLVETDHRLCAEVYLVPTPGHTPGHVSVVIESRGERAVITGDIAHHPLQYGEPDLRMYADDDPELAAATRRTFLAERTADDALVIGTHFAAPTAGHVREQGTAWRFDAVTNETEGHDTRVGLRDRS
jgi:glyoxylase-like metal-dependent hydrolase (beta-lactamase superfamily II)